MQFTIDARSLTYLGTRYLTASALVEPRFRAALDAMTPEIEAVAREQIAAVSPVKTGALQASTDTQSSVGMNQAQIDVMQPASVYWRRIKADFPYAQFLIHGTRYITARDYPAEALPNIQTAASAIVARWSGEALQALVPGEGSAPSL